MARIRFNGKEMNGDNILLGNHSIGLCNEMGMVCNLISFNSERPIRVEIEGQVRNIEVNNDLKVFGNIDYAHIGRNCYHDGILNNGDNIKYRKPNPDLKILTFLEYQEEQRKEYINARDFYLDENGKKELRDTAEKLYPIVPAQVIYVRGMVENFSVISNSFWNKSEIIVNGYISHSIIKNDLYVKGEILNCNIENEYHYRIDVKKLNFLH